MRINISTKNTRNSQANNQESLVINLLYKTKKQRLEKELKKNKIVV